MMFNECSHEQQPNNFRTCGGVRETFFVCAHVPIPDSRNHKKFLGYGDHKTNWSVPRERLATTRVVDGWFTFGVWSRPVLALKPPSCVGLPPGTPPTAARVAYWIEKYVTLDDDGCWIWTGALATGGYGTVGWLRRSLVAHKAIYEHIVGPVEKGLDLDHLCRVRACVNPSHLEPVTRGENLARGAGSNGQHRRGMTCRRNHDESEIVLTRRGHRRCRACVRLWVAAQKANA